MKPIGSMTLQGPLVDDGMGSWTTDESSILLRMTTDPDAVQQTWSPRKTESPIPAIDGGSTTFDFGLFAVDCRRRLKWSGTSMSHRLQARLFQILDTATLAQLYEWFALENSVYRYKDAEHNDWFVELLGPVAVEQQFGFADMFYKVEFTIHALQMTKYLGRAYTGN